MGYLKKRWTSEGGYREVLVIATPLILSTGAWSVQHFVDRMFLSWYSPEALAASMPAGILFFSLMSLFIGTATYVSTFVAQYYGAKRYPQCGQSTFQALLVSLACYPLLLGLSPLVRYFFVLAGHGPEQLELESLYFQTLVFGSVFLILRIALAGFFLGIGRTTVVMLANP